jgi:protocatechuate 3,4-dioxygenase beta subunit
MLLLVSLAALPACSIGIQQEVTPPVVVSSATPHPEEGNVLPTDSRSADQRGQSFEIDPTPVTTEPVEESGTATQEPQDDILSAFPPAPQINGEILLVFGHVVDASGNPISGVRVEFWQTDSNGIYDHPGDPNTQARDLAFQFYGSSAVDADGIYRFRTIVPGEYEPRPAHIHVKVKLSGTELLTTQFYLADDAENVQDEGIFRSAGEAGENLFLTTEMQTDVNGTELLVARKDIVIDSGGGGNLTITPAQTEGPYYPRVNVSEYDNDLVIVD